jgi:hypothetical protein
MSGDILHWLALALLSVAIAASFGAISARSLFVTAMHLVAAAVSVAAIVLLLGAGEGALGVALLAAAWAPVLLLAAMLLSTRAAKPAHVGSALVGWLGAALTLPLVWWPLSELGAQAQSALPAMVGMSFWLAPLLLVLAAVCLALLGYGERGAMARENTP